MQPSTIASAYLRSLVHFPTAHLCTLSQRPLTRMLTLDFELWMDGFEAALAASDFAGPLPTRDEIRWWIDVALDRYFEASAPSAEAVRPIPVPPREHAREHRDPPPTLAADARESKHRPAVVTLPSAEIGLAISG